MTDSVHENAFVVDQVFAQWQHVKVPHPLLGTVRPLGKYQLNCSPVQGVKPLNASLTTSISNSRCIVNVRLYVSMIKQFSSMNISKMC